MKKATALAALLLVMSLAAAALAAPFVIEEAGVTLEVPKEMQAERIVDREGIYGARLTIEGREDLLYEFTLRYEDAYAGVWMTEMKADDVQTIGERMAATFPGSGFVDMELEGRKFVLLLEEDLNAMHLITIVNGWFSELSVMRVGSALSDDEMQLVYYLQSDVQYGAL